MLSKRAEKSLFLFLARTNSISVARWIGLCRSILIKLYRPGAKSERVGCTTFSLMVNYRLFLALTHQLLSLEAERQYNKDSSSLDQADDRYSSHRRGEWLRMSTKIWWKLICQVRSWYYRDTIDIPMIWWGYFGEYIWFWRLLMNLFFVWQAARQDEDFLAFIIPVLAIGTTITIRT